MIIFRIALIFLNLLEKKKSANGTPKRFIVQLFCVLPDINRGYEPVQLRDLFFGSCTGCNRMP